MEKLWILFLCLLVAGVANADTCYFVGPGSDIFDVDNWLNNDYPGPYDDAVLDFNQVDCNDPNQMFICDDLYIAEVNEVKLEIMSVFVTYGDIYNAVSEDGHIECKNGGLLYCICTLHNQGNGQGYFSIWDSQSNAKIDEGINDFGENFGSIIIVGGTLYTPHIYGSGIFLCGNGGTVTWPVP